MTQASQSERDPTVEADQRDALWEVSFETYYDSYYEEIAADSLIRG